MDKEKKLELLKGTVTKINKDFGSGSIMYLEEKAATDADIISSGSLGLDLALGNGGFAKGRIVEMFGPESSGKTTLAIHVIAECQKIGGVAAFVDAEHAFDKEYAVALGVNADELLISQPDYGEQALEIVDQLASTGAVDVIVVDSVAALVPKSELEGEMGESKIGLHARLMSQALRKLTGTINKNNVLVIFINQLRDKIGVMFGNPETTTGGNALKFYASYRLDVRRQLAADKMVKEGDENVGNQTTVKVVKNKTAPPFKKAVFDILYGEGIDRLGEVIDIATELDIINKSGSWYSYNGEKIGQGAKSVRSLLSDNPEMLAEIEAKIKETLDGRV